MPNDNEVVKWKDLKNLVPEVEKYTQRELEEFGTGIQTEINKVDTKAINAQSDINAFKSSVALQYATKTDQEVLSSRMDTFTRLEEGSTTGDAELADGRVASDGTVYNNIGSAIRGQVTELKNDLRELEQHGYPMASIAEAVNVWGNEHLDEFVPDGSIAESKFNSDLKIKSLKDYVTPQMFGAVGNGIADDTTAFKNMITNLNGRYVSLPKATYKLSDTIDLTGVLFLGNRSILDFSNCTAEHCITASNKAIIKNVIIQNGDRISGYGLYLDYFANGAMISDVTIKNCTNGIYVASAWYASFRDIIVQNKENSGKCITFGESTLKASEINGVTFDNVSMQYGEYGLYCAKTVVTSVTFNNITVEKNTKCGMYFDNTSRGSISINALYCEHTALTSTAHTDGLVITAYDDMFITLQNVLIRGSYTQNPRPKLMQGLITCMPRVYNAATGADLGTVDRVDAVDNDTWINSLPERYFLFTEGNNIEIPVICNERTNLHLQLKVHFRAKGDSTQNAFTIINVYLDLQSSAPQIVLTETSVLPKYVGGHFEAEYTITNTPNYKVVETITIKNSNSNWNNGTKVCYVSGDTYMPANPRFNI